MLHEIRFSSEDGEYRRGVVQFWHIDENDAVEEGDDLIDVETDDESILTLKAPVTGRVKQIFVEEGDVVEDGSLLAIIEESEE